MRASITIRTALEKDATKIAKLTTELGYPVSAKAMRQRIAKILLCLDHLVIVAESKAGICGWLQAHRTEVIESGARVEILGLIVGEQTRRQGIGRLLVSEAENWAANTGADAIVVRSNVTRIASHAFYLALGYIQSKTQTVYRKTLRRTQS